jgi:dTDP-4-dehydrorhamnose reductase
MLDCLIVGGDSAIGQILVATLEGRGLSVGRTSRRATTDGETVFLDMETLEGLDALPQASHVALLAAETRFAVCAAEPERTWAINVDAPVAVAARAIESWGARVLFFSSIAVHDGMLDRPSEDMRPEPNSLYGEQKLSAEDQLLGAERSIAALRPSKVVNDGFPLFVEWRDKMARGERIEPFSDMLVSPVWIRDVADVAGRLLFDTCENGVFQYSSEDQLSYADIAVHIAKTSGFDEGLIAPVRAVDHLDPATLWLPKSARLDCRRLAGATGDVPPLSFEAVDRFLGAMPTRTTA